MDDNPTTGQLIKAARKKAGMTQAELASKLGVPYQSVSQWERDTRNPKYGTIKRIAAALGIDAVLLTTTSCDPLNRRAVRVSMGSVFLVPWAWVEDPQTQLNRLGFRTAAMALSPGSVEIDNPSLMAEPRLAIILGTEGDGLPRHAIEKADYVVRIPMHHTVDSLNVAAASAVAFWQLRTK